MGEAVKKGLPWWVWVLIVLGASVPVLGVFSAMAIYGVRKYVISAKTAEAQHVVPTLASAIARCASSGLPASSQAVPSMVPSAAKYMSAPTDWSSQEAFRCASFSLTQPQYFSYQWVLESPSRGSVVALADLDGDGTVEVRFEQTVECAGASGCTPGPLRGGPSR